jgi:hypothetical protein
LAACDALKLKIAGYAAKLQSKYPNVAADEISLAQEGIALKNDNSTFISFEKYGNKII